jgi:hypothetical protein
VLITIPIHVALTLSAYFLGTVIPVSLRLQEQTNKGPIILVHLSRQRLYYPMAQTRSQHLQPRRMYDVLMNHRSLTAWCTEHDTKGFTTQVEAIGFTRVFNLSHDLHLLCVAAISTILQQGFPFRYMVFIYWLPHISHIQFVQAMAQKVLDIGVLSIPENWSTLLPLIACPTNRATWVTARQPTGTL